MRPWRPSCGGSSEHVKRVRLLILALAVVPAVLLAIGEILSLRENEAMITETYRRQVEAILASLNQNTFDVAGNWAADYEGRLRRGGTPDLTDRGRSIVRVGDVSDLREAGLPEADIGRAVEQFEAGYRRISTQAHPQDSSLWLWFPVDAGTGPARIAALRLDPERFIRDELAAALELAGQDGLGLGIFRTSDSTAIHRTAPFERADAGFERELPLLPGYSLAVHTVGADFDRQLRARSIRSAILIALVMAVLVYGLWHVYRNVKRESDLARLKSDFVANVSHELKTPLALIRMFAETLEMDRVRDESKKREYYRIIGAESARLTHLIQNILDFSKMEAGRKTYRMAETDLREVVRGVGTMMADILAREGYLFTVETPDGPVFAQADADALTEALLNLTDNAMKYGRGGTRIRLALEADRILVEDDGPGIRVEDQPRLFETFFRVEDPLVQSVKGTGLGLSLVKHIADAHGWRVEVESAPGEGARFSLRFG